VKDFNGNFSNREIPEPSLWPIPKWSKNSFNRKILIMPRPAGSEVPVFRRSIRKFYGKFFPIVGEKKAQLSHSCYFICVVVKSSENWPKKYWMKIHGKGLKRVVYWLLDLGRILMSCDWKCGFFDRIFSKINSDFKDSNWKKKC
jgi:hypothetical protein